MEKRTAEGGEGGEAKGAGCWEGTFLLRQRSQARETLFRRGAFSEPSSMRSDSRRTHAMSSGSVLREGGRGWVLRGEVVVKVS